ncbi:hypothetical protein MMC24_005672 [Lignoscripta atroalba]|nr:hypothetical protein [Lignoscripta atroalba]
MRCAVRLALSAAIVLLLVVFILKEQLESVWHRNSISAYIHDALFDPWHNADINETALWDGRPEDKVIVMAKLEAENTDWVLDHLPDWRRAIYTVNPSNTTLSSPNQLITPINKGHESMAYLTYIIDHYSTLPSTIAFLHSHRSGFWHAWHTDTPMHDNVYAMRALQLPFVQANGYVNLRCNWNPGCNKRHLRNIHVTGQIWQEVFSGTSTSRFNLSASANNITGTSPADPEAMEKAIYSPPNVNVACCAQFAVSREQVLKRPVEDYIRFRRWVTETAESDAKSGRVMEFLWHVIFGKEAT